MVLNRLYRK